MIDPPEPEDLEQALRQYAIYERPSDFPDGWVVREWLVLPGQALPGRSWRGATLDEARSHLPQSVTKIAEGDPNEPTIVEVWVEG